MLPFRSRRVQSLILLYRNWMGAEVIWERCQSLFLKEPRLLAPLYFPAGKHPLKGPFRHLALCTGMVLGVLCDQ